MKLRVGAVVCVLVAGLVGACGTSEQGDPLLAGSLTAEYDGQPFTPTFGFATIFEGNGLIELGAGPIHCGSEQSSSPVVVIRVPLAVGMHGSVLVQVVQYDANTGTYGSYGADSGSVEITAVSPDSVAGTIAFDYTSGGGSHSAVEGSFAVVHCAP